MWIVGGELTAVVAHLEDFVVEGKQSMAGFQDLMALRQTKFL